MKLDSKFNKYKSDLAYIDFLWTCVLIFACFCILLMLSLKPASAPTKSIEQKAEFIITMTWPDDSFDDIDLWLLLPNQKKVGWSNKDVEYVTLDRDDRGAHGDVYTKDGVSVINKVNKEVIAIRALVPGKYVVNAHVFASYDKVAGILAEHKMPYEVQLTLLKVNPTVKDVVIRKITVTNVNEQQTAFSFEVTPDGEAVNVNIDDDVPFVPQMRLLNGLDGDPLGGEAR